MRYVMLLCLLVSGCVSVPQPAVVSADRAAGVVRVASEQPNPFKAARGQRNWDAAQAQADAACTRWGYESAVGLGLLCERVALNGHCMDRTAVREYQCSD